MDSYLQRLAMIESSGNPYAQNPNSSARGLYQFMPATAQQYGITAPFGTPEYKMQEKQAIKAFTEDNRRALRQFLQREPTEGELYLAHQQGAGGAKKLLSNPQAPAVDVVGEQAVTLNAGNPNMTAEEFAGLWKSKFDEPSISTATSQMTQNQDLNMAMSEPEMFDEELKSLYSQKSQPETFNLELPDGTILEGIPQGTTKEQIKAKLQAGGYDMSLLRKQPATEEVAQPYNFWQRMGEDLSKRVRQSGEIGQRQRELGQSLPSSMWQGAGVAAGTVNDVLGNLAISGFRALPDIVEQPIREGAGAVGEFVGDSALGRLAAGISQDYGQFAQENPIEAANLGAFGNLAEFLPISKATGAVTKSVGGGLKRTGQAIIPKIDDAVRPLAQKAKDFGIPLRMEQVRPTKVSRTAQKVSQAIPFSGTDAFERKQRQAWNKALAKTVGIGDDLSPESVGVFRKTNSKMFDDVLNGKNVNVTQDDVMRLTGVKDMDLFGLIEGDKAILNKDILKTIDDIAEGAVSGQKIASARSYLLDKSLRAGNASPAYAQLVDTLDDIALKSLSPEDALKLNTARKQYKYFKTIQPLLEKATDGEINPTQLIQRVASSKYIDASTIPSGTDDFIDLARIGKEFLPLQGGSDTVPNLILGTGVGAGVFEPSTLAATGGIMLGNRGLQSGVLRNQSIIGQMMQPRSPLFIKPTAQTLSNYGIVGAGGAYQGLTREEQ